MQDVKLYTQNAPQYEGDCEYRISSSPSLEGKYSEHGYGRRGAPSSDGLCRFICHLEWEPGKE